MPPLPSDFTDLPVPRNPRTMLKFGQPTTCENERVTPLKSYDMNILQNETGMAKFPVKRSFEYIDITPPLKRKRLNFFTSTPKPETEILTASLSPVSKIIEAVEKLSTESELVADGSRVNILPSIPGKHRDLSAISPETMSDILDGVYNDTMNKVTIIDCRYPYEYNGGHIKLEHQIIEGLKTLKLCVFQIKEGLWSAQFLKANVKTRMECCRLNFDPKSNRDSFRLQGAVNLYTKEEIQKFLQDSVTSSAINHVLIFHCEFSSERGPKMYRFLRSLDRDLNKEHYPHLNFPEIYLLEGGYKTFFYTCKEKCVPQTYKTMLHKEHKEELRHFRVKSKSWSAGDKSRRTSLSGSGLRLKF